MNARSETTPDFTDDPSPRPPTAERSVLRVAEGAQECSDALLVPSRHVCREDTPRRLEHALCVDGFIACAGVFDDLKAIAQVRFSEPSKLQQQEKRGIRNVEGGCPATVDHHDVLRPSFDAPEEERTGLVDGLHWQSEFFRNLHQWDGLVHSRLVGTGDIDVERDPLSETQEVQDTASDDHPIPGKTVPGKFHEALQRFLIEDSHRLSTRCARATRESLMTRPVGSCGTNVHTMGTRPNHRR